MEDHVSEKDGVDLSSDENEEQPVAAGSETLSQLEKFGTGMDSFRGWLVKTYRMAMLMAKGAYIVGERKKLFSKLGEEVYYKISKGEIRSAQLEPLVQQLDKLTKKVEIEEILIRSLRFGRPKRPMSKGEPS